MELQSVIEAFRNVDVEKAQASRPVDEERLKTLISKTSSFQRVDQVVRDRLVSWCTELFSTLVEDGIAARGRGDAENCEEDNLAEENARLRESLKLRDATVGGLRTEQRRLQALVLQQQAELWALRLAVSGAREVLEVPGNAADDVLRQRVLGQLAGIAGSAEGGLHDHRGLGDFDAPVMREEHAMKSLDAVFRAWDADGDGHISEEELTRVLVGIGMLAADIPAIFAQADINKDGKINYNEFIGWLYDAAPLPARRATAAEMAMGCPSKLRAP